MSNGHSIRMLRVRAVFGRVKCFTASGEVHVNASRTEISSRFGSWLLAEHLLHALFFGDAVNRDGAVWQACVTTDS